jgi:hypothetical protein
VDLRRTASIELWPHYSQQEWLAHGRLHDTLSPAGKTLPRLPSVFVDDLTATHIRNGPNFRHRLSFAAGLR